MLKDTLLKFFKLENLVHNLTGFVETRFELLKYEVREELAKNAAKIILMVFIGFLVTLFVVFASVAAAYLLSEYYGRLVGFLSVSLFYLFLAMVLFVMREPVVKKIEKVIFESIKKE
jgi:uncharacterized membrane protein YqjE